MSERGEYRRRRFCEVCCYGTYPLDEDGHCAECERKRWAKYKVNRRRKKISKGTRAAVIARDGLACRYCATPLQRADVTLDHVIPCRVGGRSGADNLVVACFPCNGRRGASAAKRLTVFRTFLALEPDPFVASIYTDWRAN